MIADSQTQRGIASSGIGRTMPNSLEAEEYLLSCCLLDGADVVARCKEAKLIPGSPGSMYDSKHGVILAVLYELHDRNVPIDVAVVAEELKTRKELDAVGGYAFLSQVSSRIPTTAQASYFIEKVREQALLRDIIRVCTGAVEDCYGYSGGIDEFVDQAETKIFAVTQNRVADAAKQMRAPMAAAMGIIGQMVERKGEITGLSSGFADLDKMLWGFQRQEMIVLAARPSMGKTALALNFAEVAAFPRRGKPAGGVLIFSLEMGASQLALRMLCSRARVSLKLLRDGFLSKGGTEQARLVAAAAELSAAPLFIDDSSAISVMQLRAKARRIHALQPLSLILVDYLQLLSPADPRMPREQQVAEASRGLKALAKELDVPVIVLSQLNRSSEKENRMPKLADLRESGAIEQDADVVMMLARPRDADERFQVAGDAADLVVAKQRNGPVGEMKLTFLRDITRFENFHQ